MKNVKILCILLTLLITFSNFLGCGKTQKETTNLTQIVLNDEQVSQINEKTEKNLTKNKFSGTAKVTLDNRDIFLDSYGFTAENKKTKINNKSIYQLGSLTKTFTGVAILQLVANGKIKLSDTLDKYFGDKSYLSDITIRHLLEMRSGLSSYTVDIQQDKKAYDEIQSIIKANPDDSKIKSYIKNYILKKGIDKVTGSFSLSHSDYFLLGLIVEDVSKMSFEKYLEKNILKPFNLKNTKFIHNNVSATGYCPETKKWKTQKNNIFLNNKYVMFSSLGLRCDINDVYTLYKNILSNDILGKNKEKLSCIDIIMASNSKYSCGFYIENNCIYSPGNTDLHSAHSYINTQTKEISILLSNHNDSDKLKMLTKDVYNITNAKVNGIILDSIK